MYKIKPLNWVQGKCFNDKVQYTAETAFGTYSVIESEGACEWKWEYCFSEYYDEGYGYSETEQEAKLFCWNNWLSRITKDLELV